MTRSVLASLKFKALVYIRRGVYLTLYYVSWLVGQKSDVPVVVFCYHAVSCDNWRFSIDFETLKKQVKFLKSRYQPITLSDLRLAVEGGKKIMKPSFVLTFDDGYKDVLATREFFKKMGIKPTLFVLSDTKNANREELETPRAFLNKREIMSLVRAGWEIGCHSASHSNLTKFSGAELEKEVKGAKKSLERDLGMKVSYFSYPKGKYSPKVLEMTKKAGYSMALSMDDGFISRNTDLFVVPRVGVDRTHTFLEFKSIFLPPAIIFRRFVGKRWVF